MIHVTKAPHNVVKLRPQDILYLCDRMRADELEQLDAFFDMPSDRIPHFFLNKTGPQFTLVDSLGVPLVCGGWESMGEGIMQSWMVGTDEAWDKHWRSITKGCRWLMDALLSNGIRRLQTNALASREAACRWYVDGLGMQPEGVWRKFGRQGQDVACFARVKED